MNTTKRYRRPATLETRKKMRETALRIGKKPPVRTAEKNNLWRGGVSDIRRRIRRIPEYFLWRSQVFQRDNWTCQTCQKRGCYLEAHHIKAFALIINENKVCSLQEARECPELWDTNNGVTLCLECHNLTKSGRLKK
jgi:5-methylcytosine-specific restriction endonuclease McrA